MSSPSRSIRQALPTGCDPLHPGAKFSLGVGGYRCAMATQILIADDHPLFRQALESVIHSIESDAKVRAVGTVSEAAGALTAESYDLVLLDLVLPGAERLSGLNDLKRAAPDTPV